jgi:hypothetical protein
LLASGLLEKAIFKITMEIRTIPIVKMAPVAASWLPLPVAPLCASMGFARLGGDLRVNVARAPPIVAILVASVLVSDVFKLIIQ